MGRFNPGEAISPKTHVLCFDLDETIRDSGQFVHPEIQNILLNSGFSIHIATSRRRMELVGKASEAFLSQVTFHGAYGHELWQGNDCLWQPEKAVVPAFVYEILQEEAANVPDVLKNGIHISLAPVGHLAFTFVGVDASRTQRNNFELFDVAEGFRERVKARILAQAKVESASVYVEGFGSTTLDVSDKPFCKTQALQNMKYLKEARSIVFFGDGMNGGNDEALAKALELENIASLERHYLKGLPVKRHVLVPVQNPQETLEILQAIL